MSSDSEYYSPPNTPPQPRAITSKEVPSDVEPPPYTPYCQASATLLPVNRLQNQPESIESPRSPPAVFKPKGFRRVTQHCTPRNCLIGIVILVVLIAAPFLAHKLNQLYNASLHTKKTLDFLLEKHDSYHGFNSSMSYDKHYNAIILSQFEKSANRFKNILLFLDNNEFRVFRTPLSAQGFHDCMRFSDNTFCCTTSVHSRNYQTKCWHQNKHHEIGENPVNIKFDQFIQSLQNKSKESGVAHYHYSTHWQHFYDGAEAIVMTNTVDNVILNVNENKHYELPEKEKINHKFAGLYFPMDGIDELDELIRTTNNFKVCQYKLDERLKKYYKKHEKCSKMLVTIEPKLEKTLFCSIPTYNGVLQYGHNGSSLELNLQINFTSSAIVSIAKTSVQTVFETVVMDCNEENISLYILGEKSVLKATVRLLD